MEMQLIERRRVDPDIDNTPSPEVLAVLELCGDARASDRGVRPEVERRESVNDRRRGDRRATTVDDADADAKALGVAAKLLAVCLIPTLLVVGRRLRSV